MTEPAVKGRRSNATRPTLGGWDELGPRAMAARARQGLSMDDVAEKSGVSKATISRFERGFDTTLSAVVSICLVLGFDLTLPSCHHEYVCKFCGIQHHEITA